MITYTAAEYRRVIFTPADELFRKCLMASAVVGALVLGVVIFAPIQREAVTHVAQLPERLARLIIEKPAPVVEPAPEAIEAVPEAEPEVIPEPEPRPRTRQEVPPDAGQIGRQRAQETITRELASTTAALQTSLDDLSSSLQTSKSEEPRKPRQRRMRRVRSGRSDGQVSNVKTNLSGGSADLGGSAVQGSNLAIGTLASSDVGFTGSSTATSDDPSGSGSPPGVHRSNSSLLAVIQKYSAGIHYCYANELKRNESLSGKLVVMMTVAASGEVIEAAVIENTLGSKRLENCALSQIRDWKFPPIAGGLTTFQAPFVFTPPK
jgi:TonB family protein